MRGQKRSRAAATQTRMRGFTLIELVVVILILGLLAGLVVPRLFKYAERAKVATAKAQISAFQTALGAFRLDTGRYPTTEEGLQALRTKPPGLDNWDGPYLPKEIPLDPWGRAYLYKYPGDRGDEPDIISYGADGREGGEGENADVVSWK